MKVLKKLFIIMFVLSFLFLGSFAIGGEWFEKIFDYQACVEWFAGVKAYAWLIGIGTLIGDIFLPLPATGIMAALGNVYGFWIGFVSSFIGSFLAGLIGYFLARFAGRHTTRRLVTDEELQEFQGLFDRWGGLAVILSRMLPVLPEVISLLAGFASMKLRTFVPALLIGTIPTAALFTFLGTVNRENSNFGIIVAVFLPAIVWLIVSPLLKRQFSKDSES